VSVSPAFRDYVVDQLAGLGPVTVRAMFGGAGLYHEAVFFGVLDDDQVFFKVDDATRPGYEAAGSGPFAPMPDAGPMRGYYQVPAEVLEDRAGVVTWAREALAVARSAKRRKAASPGRKRG
jgi:DNA transformation protein